MERSGVPILDLVIEPSRYPNGVVATLSHLFHHVMKYTQFRLEPNAHTDY